MSVRPSFPVPAVNTMQIANRVIGPGQPTYVVAEISGNHNQSFERAVELVREAKKAGADAVKLQTYTADTLTIDSDKPWFRIGGDNVWSGRTLYDLYQEAYTPWEWQPKLKRLADELGIELFSTPFDASSVEFLEREVGVAAYKVASFELVDTPLLEKIGSTGKPVILSTGMATLAEIDTAVSTLRRAGSGGIALLRCVSEYPASPEQMNVATISHLASAFSVVAGISDHSLSPAVSVAAVVLGASIVEKHFTLRRSDGGPDAGFSLEADELRDLIKLVREAEAAVGRVRYGAYDREAANIVFRRSLFVVKAVERGEAFTRENVRVIRPGHGLPPSDLPRVLGRRATIAVERGTPLTWALVGEPLG